MRCPTCKLELNAIRFQGIVADVCPKCGGKATTVNSFERRLRNDLRKGIRQWQSVPGADRQRRCPSCNGWMGTIPLSFGKTASAQTVVIDLCKGCALFWFDKSEIEHFPRDTENLAAELKGDEDLLDLKAETTSDFNEFLKNTLISGSQMPVLQAEHATVSEPILTYLFCGFALLMTAATLHHSELRQRWNYLPLEPFRKSGTTLLTHLFVHADWLHLAGNLFFFFTFATVLEKAKGSATMLFVFLFSGLAGLIAHTLFDPRPDIALIGMSGAISGIIAFVVFSMPSARVSFSFVSRPLFLLRNVFFMVLFPLKYSQLAASALRDPWLQFRARLAVPAWLWFFFWVLTQYSSLGAQLAGMSRTSVLGHLGGSAAGFLAYLL